MAAIPSRVLSAFQLGQLEEIGEVRTAEPGERIFDVGDASYPFVAILEGEVAVLDGSGQEVVRHGVVLIGTTNLPSTMPYDASTMY